MKEEPAVNELEKTELVKATRIRKEIALTEEAQYLGREVFFALWICS